MEYNTDHFLSMLAKMNISLSDKQLQQFMTYYEMLIEKNKVMNLTAITDFDEVVEKHFVDSVSLIQVVDLHHPLKVIDLGTGAGFPGIPLKIVFPELNVVLADSLNKRLVFLNEVIDALGLTEIYTVHGRAEDLARMPNIENSLICVFPVRLPIYPHLQNIVFHSSGWVESLFLINRESVKMKWQLQNQLFFFSEEKLRMCISFLLERRSGHSFL